MKLDLEKLIAFLYDVPIESWEYSRYRKRHFLFDIYSIQIDCTKIHPTGIRDIQGYYVVKVINTDKKGLYHNKTSIEVLKGGKMVLNEDSKHDENISKLYDKISNGRQNSKKEV